MIERTVRQAVTAAAGAHGYTLPEGWVLELPPEGISADYATNLALQLARAAGKPPREIAEALATSLRADPCVAVADVAGPGFLNLTLSDTAFAPFAASGDPLAVPAVERPERINVEYVSANPTGPLHIGNARGGPVGETIARVLSRLGHKVTREFYINDIGGQANLFAASVLHFLATQAGEHFPFPEKGYPGAYVQELAATLAERGSEPFLQPLRDVGYFGENEPDYRNPAFQTFRQAVIAAMVANIRATCDRLGIQFDVWTPQSQLVETNASAATLALLTERGATYEADGAIWLKSGFAEGDRETVLVKSNGDTTYFLDDVAYHRDKLQVRAFDRSIVVLGPNHVGHTPRMRAGLRAIGIDPNRYLDVTYQHVQLKAGGQTLKMAKREGTFVSTDAVLDEVPAEVFTYFVLSKANESHVDFDLQLAKDTSEKNPVYYIQYAHARIRSLLRLASERGVSAAPPPEGSTFSQPERALMTWLDRYPALVHEVAGTYRVNLIPTYLSELARRYHFLYAHERILTDDLVRSAYLVRLSQLTADTIRDGLNLMRIDAKERM